MIYSRIRNKAERSPEAEAIVWSGGRITYGLLLEEIRKRAFYFRDFPDTVLLSDTDEKENLLNFLTLMSIGRKSVFASRNVSSEQRAGLAAGYGAAVVSAGIPFGEGWTDIEEGRMDTDVFLGVLSSGTTGTPKVIWKDFGAWFSAFPHQSEVFSIHEQDRVFVLDALSYSANLNSALHTLWLGATLVLGSLKSAPKWAEQLREEQVSSVFMVPSHYRILADRSPVLPDIRSLVSAGEKLDPHTATALMDLFPGVLLTEYYGAAELGHIAYHQNRDIVEKPAEVGKPFPGVEIRMEGQLIRVSSPYVSPDYRKDPTVRDLGYVENGRLVVLGREGRMFNRRGLNILAEEVENAALRFPALREAALVERPASGSRKSLFLYYSGYDKQQVPVNDLREFLLKILPKEKLPNAYRQLPELPHNLAGKIDFNALSRKPAEEDHSLI